MLQEAHQFDSSPIFHDEGAAHHYSASDPGTPEVYSTATASAATPIPQEDYYNQGVRAYNAKHPASRGFEQKLEMKSAHPEPRLEEHRGRILPPTGFDSGFVLPSDASPR